MWQIKHDAISRKLSKAQEKVWGMLKAEFMKWLFRSALLISLAFNWRITVRTTIQTILTLTLNTQSDLWTSRTLKICHYHNPWVTKPVPCPLFNHWLYFWSGASLSHIKGNSLNFIRLLRVVITPSEEKTTQSNRIKFRLLPLMYSRVIWCEFIDLVGFLAVIVWPLSLSS